MSKQLEIECVRGVAGVCLLVDGARVAGPKPWGGGAVIHSWTVDLKEIKRALPSVKRRARKGDE